jgi:tetratricopeptide (TPR) repeat protein
MINQPIALALLGICLLPSCASLPAPVQMMFQPAEQVRHSGGDVASAYYRLGRYHQDHGDLALALTAYTYAIARNPNGAEARIAAAVIHAQHGRLPQARAMLLAVCAEYPGLVQPRNNLGYVYYLQGEYAAAAEAFREVIAMEPANERARNNLALAESAGTRRVAAVIETAPAQVAPVAPTVSAAAAEPEGGMRLVKHAPNMYELKIVRQDAPVAAVDVPASRLEIANGNGIPGMARRYRQALAARGIAAVRLTNAKPFGRAGTSIEFRPGFEQQARSLQAAIGGKAAIQAAGTLKPHTDLRLVLGKDADLAFEHEPGVAGGPLLTSAGSTPSINH